MKALQPATRDAPARALEADLACVVSTLFRRWPALLGFSVRDQGELCLAEVEMHPWSDADQRSHLRGDIAAALLELMDEAPDARMLLSGRTFARTLH